MTLVKPIQLDLTGLKCPLPVLKARRALTKIEVGQRVEIRCTDPVAAIDIPHMVEQSGDRLVMMKRVGAELVFLVEKSEV